MNQYYDEIEKRLVGELLQQIKYKFPDLEVIGLVSIVDTEPPHLLREVQITLADRGKTYGHKGRALDFLFNLIQVNYWGRSNVISSSSIPDDSGLRRIEIKLDEQNRVSVNLVISEKEYCLMFNSY